MVKEVVFRCQSSLMGSFEQPQPPISHLEGVILLQRGRALVGAWDAESCGFIHPVNQNELESEALAAILAVYCDAELAGQELRIFTCPEHLVTQFHFGAWHEEWLIQSRSDH